MRKFLLTMATVFTALIVLGAESQEQRGEAAAATSSVAKMVFVYKSGTVQTVSIDPRLGTLTRAQNDFENLKVGDAKTRKEYSFTTPERKNGTMVIDLAQLASVLRQAE